jgi:hypothetical protein
MICLNTLFLVTLNCRRHRSTAWTASLGSLASEFSLRRLFFPQHHNLNLAKPKRALSGNNPNSQTHSYPAMLHCSKTTSWPHQDSHLRDAFTHAKHSISNPSSDVLDPRTPSLANYHQLQHEQDNVSTPIDEMHTRTIPHRKEIPKPSFFPFTFPSPCLLPILFLSMRQLPCSVS